MKAAELFVKCLENEGVECIFGVPGEENVDIPDALLDSPIRLITTRHEQGAPFMAYVYRASGYRVEQPATSALYLNNPLRRIRFRSSVVRWTTPKI